MRRHPLVQMLAIGTVAAVVGVALTLSIDWFPVQAAEEAGKIDTLYDVLLVASVPVFVLVMTVAIYCVWKFRVRPGETRDGAPIHGNTLLEAVWVTIPFLMVSGLAIYAWVVLDDIEAAKPRALSVQVTGQQFAWSFEVPRQPGVPQAIQTTDLHLPKGRQVHFEIESRDVIHSFWVPDFRLKKDAVPGITTDIRLTPSREGSYQVVCAELCGLGHSTMRQIVRVVPPAEWERWVRESAAGEGQTQ